MHAYNGNIFMCSSCGKEYKSGRTLKNHKCPHCHVCQRTYSTWQKYLLHPCQKQSSRDGQADASGNNSNSRHAKQTSTKSLIIASTSVDTLCSQVGETNHLIPDDVICYILNLIRRSYNSVTVGALLPAEVESLLMNREKPSPCVPVDAHSVNIHYTSNHWITSWQDPCERKVKVYDSLYNSMRITNILPALRLFYNLSHYTVEYPVCASQQSEAACGAYALAFALMCADHVSPENTLFDESKLRMHLKSCIRNSALMMFPVLSGPEAVTSSYASQSQRHSSSQAAVSHHSTYLLEYELVRQVL